mgnify:CR=1 FL=1
MVDTWHRDPNMASEDIPPENIWHHRTRLKEWWDGVRERIRSGKPRPGREEVPEGEMIQIDNSDLRAELMAP